MMKKKLSALPPVNVITDRLVLEDLFKCNPENTLGWPVDKLDSDISTWRGVGVDNNGRVVKLNLGGCNHDGNSLFNLTVLPVSIGKLEHLIYLDLCTNQLAEIPVEIGNLTKLMFLDLGENKLTNIPFEIGNLIELRTLYLHTNKLMSLPAEIGSLARLTQLGLSSNQLKTLPSEIGNLDQLVYLNLMNNIDLVTIPQEVCDLENKGTSIFKDKRVTCAKSLFKNVKKYLHN
ncbi:leucine-rich repeat domain-containing protein [Flavobacterium sp. W22_SRS_FK3]|uniref:leucine-rich repeat domain-containing protein n=1 Tax=Flavobacterium sp. W22_SRS_FK3 TaxID=3240275 RepID=UPI003F8F3031